MREALAIRLQNVSKIYKLHGSQSDQLIDVMGLQRLGFKTKTPSKEFVALSDVSLEVPRGHRIGIVGRNGAGKTTLLKLICGNFAPTLGEVEVNGTVQALMNIGLGFHPEYTGRQNVEASLQYNGLARDEYQKAMEGIIDFCELGDFMDQPFKTYSLGMQARLMFAAATAIRPDILIVDEVLGAGDAYFVAKSKSRVEKLVSSGCTMLLVSHSMQQVLELCDEAIWLDKGAIRMQGEAFLVVKAYEEYLHGYNGGFDLDSSIASIQDLESNSMDGAVFAPSKAELNRPFLVSDEWAKESVIFQEPQFMPHAHKKILPNFDARDMHFQAPGGLSRWESDNGLKVTGFAIVTERGLTNKIVALRPAKFLIRLISEHTGSFSCRYGLAIHDPMGVCVTRLFSPEDVFDTQKGSYRDVEIYLNPCQIGPGLYTLGISVHPYESIERLNNTGRYDLLSRSFQIEVELPESYAPIEANFFHSAEWEFKNLKNKL